MRSATDLNLTQASETMSKSSSRNQIKYSYISTLTVTAGWPFALWVLRGATLVLLFATRARDAESHKSSGSTVEATATLSQTEPTHK